MIINCHPHGRTASATTTLVAHLLSTEGGQCVHLVRVRGSLAQTLAAAVKDFTRLRDGSRATVAFLHLTLSPARPWSGEQRDEAVARIRRALGAEQHGYALVEHAGKPRARGESGDTHWHILVCHVGPDGRALDTAFLHARLEAVRASLEVDFGEPLTASRRTDAVARRLRAMGRDDVAAAVEAIRPAPDALPRSGLTSATRARLARVGISAPTVRAEVLTAYERSDTGSGFKAALEELGLDLVPGDTPWVWLIRQDGHLIGAVDRLVGRSRAEVVARMTAPIGEPSPDRTAMRAAEPEQQAGSEVAPAGSPSPRPQVPAALGDRETPADTGEPPIGPGDRTTNTTPAGSASWPAAEDDVRGAAQIWTDRIAREREALEETLAELRCASPLPPCRHAERRQAQARLDAASAAERTAETALRHAQKSALAPRGIGARLRDTLARMTGGMTQGEAEIQAAAGALARARDARKAASDAVRQVREQIGQEAIAYEKLREREAVERAPAERGILWDLARLRDQQIVLERWPQLALKGRTAIEAAVDRLRRARVEDRREQWSADPRSPHARQMSSADEPPYRSPAPCRP
ncbi:relaxase/mobilization nuclease domain-containing protein [Methylobacterium isbiliense]|uniref:MobA/VirD2-like nuclease domain-containing protein n=1 Tax=Methylobacterium isbiliense TaxID=315478 RepID=A0ABQ4SAS8_9HYPH|nr:hypothetical protein [Methylobacterium isbiliense]MDN3626640.1 hypothetical protein [Methylobacterium isbiliense]GJD99257.1 hypothetical protein GMJLKIPL_1173 [Methylobacterium isbiliense]